MAQDQSTTHSRPYWRIWGILLVLTVVMIFVDGSPLSRGVMIVVLVAAMLSKAALIGAYFMHLRFETVTLVMTVVVGLLVTGLILFVLIAPDGLRALNLSAW